MNTVLIVYWTCEYEVVYIIFTGYLCIMCWSVSMHPSLVPFLSCNISISHHKAMLYIQYQFDLCACCITSQNCSCWFLLPWAELKLLSDTDIVFWPRHLVDKMSYKMTAEVRKCRNVRRSFQFYMNFIETFFLLRDLILKLNLKFVSILFQSDVLIWKLLNQPVPGTHHILTITSA